MSRCFFSFFLSFFLDSCLENGICLADACATALVFFSRQAYRRRFYPASCTSAELSGRCALTPGPADSSAANRPGFPATGRPGSSATERPVSSATGRPGPRQPRPVGAGDGRVRSRRHGAQDAAPGRLCCGCCWPCYFLGHLNLIFFST
ncbi:hypothetical protein B0I35DRAFT_430120 [Stachybotrys elegans]|uniref:Secreted protein n=1 Tax=Stachybotrys elegans TaxID=80388 RepID=A0A8K0ST12_9HYPO|nr:hypothetical protein B0I35DRAFT_430120 [Stachybotrys elegans]